MTSTPQTNNEPRPYTLANDFGTPLTLTASVLAEDLHFSPATGLLTVEKLYRAVDGTLGYGIIAASGETRERRSYLLDEQGETVVVKNGAVELELPVDLLHEFLAMALQEDACKTVGEHALIRPAVNED